VVAFYYGGWSDTSVALLNITSNIEETGLKILLTNGSVFADTNITSDETFGFAHGNWDLLFYKSGFDTVLIENYYAVPDQVSSVQIFMTKGNQKVRYKTSPPAYLFPKNGRDTTFYKTGQIKSIEEYKNDKLIYQIRNFEDGSLRYKSELLENGLNFATQFYDNKQVEFIAYWNKGTTEGYRKEFFRDGRLKEHLLNTEEGQLRWYKTDSIGNCIIENGNTNLEYRKENNLALDIDLYKGGLKEGKWIYYRSDGTLLWIEEYEDGKKILFEHYSNDGTLTKRVEN
jgi:antitoxin component YwqK of YwqJK toxin-antitoxin module